jgi:nucleotide-binding universal stress UspA family protein
MKKILVPVDFSARSITAVEMASVIAEKSKGKITLLHVLVDPYIFLSAPNSYLTPALETGVQIEYISKLEESSNINLKKLASTLLTKSLSVKTVTKTGASIYREILNYAEDNKYDLIVMGTNGAKSLGEIFLGTNAERIVRFTDTPVLVVGKKIKTPAIRKIVFASKFDQTARQVFPFINNFAKLFKANIYLLRINTKDDFIPTQEAIEEMKSIYKGKAGSYQIALRDAYEVDDGIVKYADEINADVIAIGVHRRSGPSRLFTDRVVEGLLRLTGLPVLGVDIKK